MKAGTPSAFGSSPCEGERGDWAGDSSLKGEQETSAYQWTPRLRAEMEAHDV